MAAINPDFSASWQRAKFTATEWLSVIIASAATVIALISMFTTSISVGVIFYQNDKIEQLDGSVDIYRIRAAKMDAWLKAHGVPTEDIYNE